MRLDHASRTLPNGDAVRRACAPKGTPRKEQVNQVEHTESTSPPRPQSERIVGLDGLRGVSILLVLFGHAAATFPPDNRLEGVIPYLNYSSLGVTTFFIISGFLITFLLRKEWEKSGTIRLRAFYARRVLRIFPAFYTFIITVTLLRAFGYIYTTYADISMAGLFLTNYKRLFTLPTNDHSWFVGHCWSLSLEEQFYLLWPATILVLGIRRAPHVAVLIVLTAPIIRVATYFTWPDARGLLGMMLHTGADPIMIGCSVALLQGRPRFDAILNRFSSWCWPLFAGLFLFVLIPWVTMQFHEHYYYLYMLTVGTTLRALAVVFIMLWVIQHPTSLLGRVLSFSILRYIGILSYSLYLWQQLFLTTKNSSWSGAFPVNLVACFVAAGLSYWLIESPFLRLRDRFRAAPRSPIDTSGNNSLVKAET